MAVGVALLGVTAVVGVMLGAGWAGLDSTAPRTIVAAGLPRDAPDRGMVYAGLSPAGPGSLCAGSYAIGSQTCTHGPDPAPAGLDVRRAVTRVAAPTAAPVAPQHEPAQVPPDAEIIRDEGGSALTPGAPALIPDAAPGNADFVLGRHGVACAGDGRDGRRFQTLYVHERGTPSRYPDFLGSIRAWSAGVDGIIDASAGETGGSRHVRFVTTPQCEVDVSEVELPPGALRSFPGSIDALQTLGYNRTDRKYLIFADAQVYCGIGTYVADNRPGLGNRNNGGPSYGRVDSGCWGPVTAAHEVTHMLGTVLHGSPNASGAGGCTDDHDLLCGPDRSGRPVRTVCGSRHEERLDCGHDDYFSTDPRPGSYLATHWNTANNEFLLRSDGGGDIPDVPGAAVGATPAGTTTPAQAPRGNGQGTGRAGGKVPTAGSAGRGGGAVARGPAGRPVEKGGRAAATAAAAAPSQAALEVRDSTSTAVRLLWSEAAPGTAYRVLVDGVPIATTVATRARLIGLRPDSAYTVTVEDTRHGYRATAPARTAPAARPTPGTWFVLTNALTGGAADLYAAQTADGTPITLGDADGDAQEQWQLVPAAGGAFTVRSRATGKCVTPLDGLPVAGQPLVQADCAVAGGVGWVLRPSEHGCTLQTAVGNLVVGAGARRFGADRLLVLQEATGALHQSWTAVPG